MDEDVARDNCPTKKEFLANDLQLGGTWIQCSYNGQIRKQYPGTGYFYDSDVDVFIAPQPYSSWSLDENYDWKPPVPMPESNSPEVYYRWDEEQQNWIEERFPSYSTPEMKTDLIRQVNELRVYHELGGFAYDGHSFESDRDSILRISNAALSAANNPEFSVFWNDHENVPVQLDQAGMLGMQAALVSHGEACFLHAQQLKAQIEAAETTEELAAIDLTEGWP